MVETQHNPEYDNKLNIAYNIIGAQAKHDRLTWKPKDFTPVQIRRSSGAIEPGWEIIAENERGFFLVWNWREGGYKYTKQISTSELVELNPQLGQKKKPAQIADPQFELDSSLRYFAEHSLPDLELYPPPIPVPPAARKSLDRRDPGFTSIKDEVARNLAEGPNGVGRGYKAVPRPNSIRIASRSRMDGQGKPVVDEYEMLGIKVENGAVRIFAWQYLTPGAVSGDRILYNIKKVSAKEIEEQNGGNAFFERIVHQAQQEVGGDNRLQRDADKQSSSPEQIIEQFSQEVAAEIAQRLDLRFPIISQKIIDFATKASKGVNPDSFKDEAEMQAFAHTVMERMAQEGHNPLSLFSNAKDGQEIWRIMQEIIHRKGQENISIMGVIANNREIASRLADNHILLQRGVEQWFEIIFRRWAESNEAI